MYPYDLFLGLDLYDLMILFGFFGALVYFRLWADRLHFGARLQNLCIVAALVAMIGGYGSAVLFQAFYAYLESGIFAINAQTGATFYGGLVGGAALFLAVYFIGGRLILKSRIAEQSFMQLANIAAGSIALAHGLGRLGCLFAGCCHGRVTDAWYGIYNVSLGQKTVPVQLLEAVFLLTLVVLFTYRLHKGLRGNFAAYLCLYAVWRFFIEYLRADERGASFVPLLSPSQLTAVLLLLVGVGYFFLERYLSAPTDAEKGEGECGDEG